MRDNFSVRSRGESVPFGFEFAFEIEIIFYYPVMDDGDSGFAVKQRVRVFLHWSTVCRPAGMPDADGSGKEVEVVLGVDLVESSTVLLYRKSSIGYGYFADRVVSSIFQSFEGSVNDRSGFLAIVEDAAEYSTQGREE
jgi:hypothetical protein